MASGRTAGRRMRRLSGDVTGRGPATASEGRQWEFPSYEPRRFPWQLLRSTLWRLKTRGKYRAKPCCFLFFLFERIALRVSKSNRSTYPKLIHNFFLFIVNFVYLLLLNLKKVLPHIRIICNLVEYVNKYRKCTQRKQNKSEIMNCLFCNRVAKSPEMWIRLNMLH